MTLPTPPAPSGTTWQPAVDAAKAAHADACGMATDPSHEWYYCPLAPAVPDVARRLGLIEPPRLTLAERHAADLTGAQAAARPDLDTAFCECSHKRRGHSADGLRCFASPCPCQAEGGWRERGRPETWGQPGSRALSLNPEHTGRALGDAVDRPDWFVHGD